MFRALAFGILSAYLVASAPVDNVYDESGWTEQVEPQEAIQADSVAHAGISTESLLRYTTEDLARIYDSIHAKPKAADKKGTAKMMTALKKDAGTAAKKKTKSATKKKPASTSAAKSSSKFASAAKKLPAKTPGAAIKARQDKAKLLKDEANMRHVTGIDKKGSAADIMDKNFGVKVIATLESVCAKKGASGVCSFSISSNQGANFKLTLKNPSKKQIKVLKRATPCGGMMQSNLLLVRDEKTRRLEYSGPIARRVPLHMIEGNAAEQEFITIEAGKSASCDFDISGVYDFAADGLHYIRLMRPPGGQIDYQDLMATEAKFEVTGVQSRNKMLQLAEEEYKKASKRDLTLLEQTVGGGFKFRKSCTADQQKEVAEWARIAKRWLENAATCTTTGCKGCDAAKKSGSEEKLAAGYPGASCKYNVAIWFGDGKDTSQSRFAESVTKTLKNMIAKWEDSEFDCNPDADNGDTYRRSTNLKNDPACASGSTFAYVYPSSREGQVVHLCPFTFQQPPLKEYEKYQTILHEMSHFDSIGVGSVVGGHQEGERDKDLIPDEGSGKEPKRAYGETAGIALAKKQPLDAMNNADNIGYFIRDAGMDVIQGCDSMRAHKLDCNKQLASDKEKRDKKTWCTAAVARMSSCQNFCGVDGEGRFYPGSNCKALPAIAKEVCGGFGC